MDIVDTGISGLLLIKPKVYSDDRGFFFESYNCDRFCEAVGDDISFVQDNHSRSSRNVLRGLHYQRSPHEQGKLVRVVSGEVFDVAVDMRRDSPTLGRWFGVHLSGENNHQLWIPPGFAHGFLVLSENADFLYKTTGYWNSAAEGSIRWNSPKLAIKWPLTGEPIVSHKDAAAPLFDSV